MYFFGHVILSLTNSLGIIFLLGLIITFGEMFASPILQTYEAVMMDESVRGTYSAFSNFGNNLTQLVGALGLAKYGWIGDYVMATILAVCGLFSFMFFHYSLKAHEENSKKW